MWSEMEMQAKNAALLIDIYGISHLITVFAWNSDILTQTKIVALNS